MGISAAETAGRTVEADFEKSDGGFSQMMAAVGAFLGVKRTLMTILAGSLLGSVIGVCLIALTKKGRDYELPFGTFLGAGALLVLFFGTPALHWYLALMGVK